MYKTRGNRQLAKMRSQLLTTRQSLTAALIIGSLISVMSFLFQSDQPFFSEVELLFLFGASVSLPLSLTASQEIDRNGRVLPIFRIISIIQPILPITIVLATSIDETLIATLLSAVWLLQTSLIGLYGLQRLVRRPYLAVEELCMDAGYIYLPVSGIWFAAYCADFRLLSFEPAFVLLTATHFAYIGPGALVISGMMGRLLFKTSVWRLYRAAASALIISPAVVATGITVTRYSGHLWLESGSAFILASSLMMLTMLQFARQLPEQSLPRLLLRLALATLLLTMSLAIAYPLGRLTGIWSLSLSTMVHWHGWFNALGFALLGLLSFVFATPVSHVSPSGIPFSRFSGRLRIGPDFFERSGAIDNEKRPIPTGIVAHMPDYQQQDLDVGQIPPEIIAFYEHTDKHELLVYPEWQKQFKPFARIYKRLSSRLGQMNFPLAPEQHEMRISSAIVSLNDRMDGRSSVRGWIRTYTETNTAVYVAAYSTHDFRDTIYMNIAFPLPLGNLTSILKLKNLSDAQRGMELTSFSTRCEDQGVFFASRLLTIRLPVNETITVYAKSVTYDEYPPDFELGEIRAQHKMWLFGLHFLTLHYAISRKSKVISG